MTTPIAFLSRSMQQPGPGRGAAGSGAPMGAPMGACGDAVRAGLWGDAAPNDGASPFGILGSTPGSTPRDDRGTPKYGPEVERSNAWHRHDRRPRTTSGADAAAGGRTP